MAAGEDADKNEDKNSPTNESGVGAIVVGIVKNWEARVESETMTETGEAPGVTAAGRTPLPPKRFEKSFDFSDF